jgi:hypothetical protein
VPSYRVIKSGHIVEIYEYQRSISRKIDDDFKSNKGGRHNEGKEERKMEYSGAVNHKARNKIRRLISANFSQESLFVTLTYAREEKDVKTGNYDLKKFLQKMKRRQKDFKYVAVIEFQEKRGGVIHYHMLCNYRLTWDSHKELQAHERDLAAVWGNGFVDIGYKKTDNAGAYLIKYMTKENNDDRLRGQKRYFFSRNCMQPEELEGGAAVEVIQEFEDLPPVFTNEYYSDFHGKVKYSEFNPMRYDYNSYKDSIKVLEDNAVNKAYELFGDLVEEV